MIEEFQASANFKKYIQGAIAARRKGNKELFKALTISATKEINRARKLKEARITKAAQIMTIENPKRKKLQQNVSIAGDLIKDNSDSTSGVIGRMMNPEETIGK